MMWNNVRELVLALYGNAFDGDPDDEPCFYCPHCAEPVYEVDFPTIDIVDGHPICPICEEVYE